MKIAFISLILLGSMDSASAQLYGTGSNSQSSYVNGYTNSNGNYVQGYQRTNPNSTTLDNYGTRGNYNPYTGSYGTRRPY